MLLFLICQIISEKCGTEVIRADDGSPTLVIQECVFQFIIADPNQVAPVSSNNGANGNVASLLSEYKV